MSETATRYRGDIDANETWRRLNEQPDAVLVDVRTRAEWSFVGVPDLSGLGREPLFIEWQHFPGGAPNEGFVDALSGMLSAQGVGQDTPLYFICRSGGRSGAAATAMTAAGYSQCFNVAGGFEGRLDAARHRGGIEGWKATGLPWVQS